MMTQDDLKNMVGNEAVKYIKNDTVIGLGSGTTVSFLVKLLAEKVKSEHLIIKIVSSSYKTILLAESLGLAVSDFDSVGQIDLTFEGADELDSSLNGIKGGGTALLREKILANNSIQTIWLIDESQFVDRLGKYPLPVEVNPFGIKHTISALDKLKLHPKLRVNQGSAMIKTDSDNYIVDISLKDIDNVENVLNKLSNIAGIVDHGLLLNYCDTAIVGTQDGIQVIHKS